MLFLKSMLIFFHRMLINELLPERLTVKPAIYSISKLKLAMAEVRNRFYILRFTYIFWKTDCLLK